MTSTRIANADCSGIDGVATMQDGAWLFRTKGTWLPVTELKLTGDRLRRVSFAYVVNEPILKAGRRGIVVVKTGVEGPLAKNIGRVTLARETFTPVDKCQYYSEFKRGSVSSRSYDIYHDLSGSISGVDEATLESFHVTYLDRTGTCQRSNNETEEAFFRGRWRSNRSEFSFSRRIVLAGQDSLTLDRLRIGTAYAEPRFQRNVVIKRYLADENGLACVRFRNVLKPGSFVRLNDLERRVGLFRADEQSWNWPK